MDKRDLVAFDVVVGRAVQRVVVGCVPKGGAEVDVRGILGGSSLVGFGYIPVGEGKDGIAETGVAAWIREMHGLGSGLDSVDGKRWMVSNRCRRREEVAGPTYAVSEGEAKTPPRRAKAGMQALSFMIGTVF